MNASDKFNVTAGGVDREYPDPCLWRADAAPQTTEEIEALIQRHMVEVRPRLERLWGYFKAKNPKILSRPRSDPDNRTPFGYGRKLVNTWTGYAYRPGYISYRPATEADAAFVEALNDAFGNCHETIKTERAGRNTAIFGVAYEVHYVDKALDGKLDVKAEPKFYSVDPREVVLLYDRSPEPVKLAGIRYYPVGEGRYRVEAYLPDRVTVYDRVSDRSGKWTYSVHKDEMHFYGEVPVSAFYLGDEMLGIVEPVAPIIDDYDLVVSDSMVEFSRFANAYLRVVGMALGDSTGNNPSLTRQVLARFKQLRIFDRLKDKEDVSFLTKDIPKDFIGYMTGLLREQIHSQSHVPDFDSDKFKGALSGAAIKRMLFDFENLVSSAEADFNVGLYERITLVGRILEKAGIAKGDPGSVVIPHRRNLPVDEADSADVAVKQRAAGLSMETVLENMPREVVPDVQLELERQAEEREAAMPDVDATPPPPPGGPTGGPDGFGEGDGDGEDGSAA